MPAQDCLKHELDGSSFEAWGGRGAWDREGAWGESGDHEVFTAVNPDDPDAGPSPAPLDPDAPQPLWRADEDWDPLDPNFDYYGKRIHGARSEEYWRSPERYLQGGDRAQAAGEEQHWSSPERQLQTTPTSAPTAAPAGGATTAATTTAVSQFGQDDNALSAERVYPECGKQYVAMYFNPDYQEMNATVMKNCRVRVENKLQGCCNTVRFKEWGENSLAKTEDIVEDCSSCSVNCEHFYFAEFCKDYFGKACQVKRRPLKGLDFEIIETFCIPSACANDKKNIEGILSFFDIRYRRVRSGWRYNYGNSDSDLVCDSGMTETILIVAGALVFVIGAIMLCLFLFKPPPESKKPQSRRPKQPAS